MEGPRQPMESEYSKVMNFLDTHLRPSSKWSVAAEYPTALNLQNLNNIKVIFEEGQVVSHAVLRPTIVKTPSLFLKVGAVGSVVTDQAFRNKGFSKALIQDCLKSAEQQMCDFAILWTNLYDFYRKLGFELAGSEVSFVIDKELDLSQILLANRPGGAAPYGQLKEGVDIDPKAILKLYQKHTVTSLRSESEVKNYLSIPNARVFSLWDQGHLMAYAVLGKGEDLSGYIHEWGGSVSHLFYLLNAIRKQMSGPITIICPKHAENLIKQLGGQGLIRNDGYLGMIAITNPKQLFGKIKRSARMFGVHDLVLEAQEHNYYLGRSGHVFKTDSLQDMTKLIFGPGQPEDLYAFDLETLKILKTVFPIQFWMWGWDSI